MGLSPDDQRFWEAHAISDEIRSARGYLRYRQGDPDGFVAEAWPDEKNQKFAERRIHKTCGGLVIPRFPPDGLELEPVYAELRPDRAVLIDDHPHWHGSRRLTADERKRLKRKWISSEWDARKHINKPVQKGGHGGVNLNEVHAKERWAKYLFPKGPHAKRIDVHPLAQERLRGAERVYFGLEGCLKADAILSAIFATQESASVVSVPSVTLWPWEVDEDGGAQFSELELVARRLLRQAEVVLVPDADWIKNGLVFRQAMLCREFLRARGVNAHIGAPPIDDFEANSELKGVDDSLAPRKLGGAGRTLADLVVIDRPVKAGIPLLVKHRWGQRRWRIDRHGPGILRTLALFSGIHLAEDGKTPTFTSDGTIKMSMETTARVLGLGRRTAQRTLVDLVETTDALELIEGSTRVTEGWHCRGVPLSEPPKDEAASPPPGVYWQPLEYVSRPTFRLHRELRPAEQPAFQVLGEFGRRLPAAANESEKPGLSRAYARQLESAARREVFAPFEKAAALNVLVMYVYEHLPVRRIAEEVGFSVRKTEKIIARWKRELGYDDRLKPQDRKDRAA